MPYPVKAADRVIDIQNNFGEDDGSNLLNASDVVRNPISFNRDGPHIQGRTMDILLR